MSGSNDLVLVRRFSTVHEARVAQSVVSAAGIPCDLADHHIVAANWLYSNLVGGVKLRVPYEQAEEALSLLDTAAEPLDDPSSGTEHPFNSGDRCSVCGVADFEALTQGRRGAIATLFFLGLPLVPVRHVRRCRHCGTISKRGNRST
jgi:hypothetical protein